MIFHQNKQSSSQEFNLQLTQTLINTPTHSRNPFYSSLDYTSSQISIKIELQDHVPIFTKHIKQLNKDKSCCQITASTRQTINSIKNTYQSQSLVPVSSKPYSSVRKIKTKNIEFPSFCYEERKRLATSVKENYKENFRLRKSISVKQKKEVLNRGTQIGRNTPKQIQIKPLQIKILKNAFKIRKVNLQSNQTRGKIYLKKLIQNRAAVLHISESCNEVSWQTKHSNVRI